MGVMSGGHTNDSDLYWMDLDTREMGTGSECRGGKGYVVGPLELRGSGRDRLGIQMLSVSRRSSLLCPDLSPLVPLLPVPLWPPVIGWT